MAKVPNVVLYHIIPPLPSAIFKGIFLGDAPKYYDGSMTIGEDGMMISLPVGSKSIRTKYLFR